MKKIFSYTIAGLMGIASLMSCSKNEDLGPAATDIDQSTLTSESREGAVKLKWQIPADANYKYVRVTYTHPGTQKEVMRMASVYSDSIVIDDLLKRYGPIEFKLQPVTAKGNAGKTVSITAESLALPKVTRIVESSKEKLVLANPTDDIYVDNPESSEGPYQSLVDNNNSTFYHMSWSSPTAWPHYIIYKLPRSVKAFNFTYKCRNNANRDNPSKMRIWVSNQCTSWSPETDKAVLVEDIAAGLPEAQAADYTSKKYILDGQYQYVWFEVLASRSGGKWVALAEMHVNAYKTSVFDPETGITTEE